MKIKIFTPKNQKLAFLIAAFILVQSPLYAQDINSSLRDIISNIKTPMNTLVGVLAIVGGFGVFYQYKSGNEKAKQNMIMLCLGLCVWFLLPAIVKIFIPSFVW